MITKCIQTNVKRIRKLDSIWLISLPFQVVFSWKKHTTSYIEGSHLSYPELNTCCVKEDTIIILGHIFMQ